MRKSFKLFLIFFVVFATKSIAQDFIVLKNGDEIKSKVLEITQTELRYKKFDNIDGPTFTISKIDVFMIRYANGSKDVINSIAQTNSNSQYQNQKQGVVNSDSHQNVQRAGYYAITIGMAIPSGDLSSFYKKGININLGKFGYLLTPNFGISGSWIGSSFTNKSDNSGVFSYGCFGIGALTTIPSQRLNIDFKGQLGYLYGTEKYKSYTTTYYYGGRTSTSSSDETANYKGVCFILGSDLRLSLSNRISLIGGVDYVIGKINNVKISSINISAGIALKFGKSI